MNDDLNTIDPNSPEYVDGLASLCLDAELTLDQVPQEFRSAVQKRMSQFAEQRRRLQSSAVVVDQTTIKTAVEAILGAVKIPVQLGGGIRNLGQIESWLNQGIRRVILGTVALRDPALVREACRMFPGRIAVGIDARGGRVAVEGWAETSDLAATDLARRFSDAGVSAIIFTDVDRDGILKGLNIESTLELAQAVPIPVIASGGLASMNDINRMLHPDCSILEGAISGRALYDGRIDVPEALRLLRGAR